MTVHKLVINLAGNLLTQTKVIFVKMQFYNVTFVFVYKVDRT